MQGQADMNPIVVEVDSFLTGNSNAVCNQLVHVARIPPDRAREFARQATFEVAIRLRIHGEEVPHPSEGVTRASRVASIVADGGHKGFCGRHQASIIAVVRTHDVLARSGAPVARKYKNQLAYATTVAPDCMGKGLQLHRVECFTQAFRALFPSDEDLRQALQNALCSRP